MTKIKTTLKYSIFAAVSFIVAVASAGAAQKPVLLFSDITSGPKTGLNDGVGQGAIVTVWGKNLGSSKQEIGTGTYCNNTSKAHLLSFSARHLNSEMLFLRIPIRL